MANFKDDLSRRDFLKQLTASGIVLLYGCSEGSTAPNQNPPATVTTKIALHKTDDRSEGVKSVMELLDFPSMQGKHVVVKPNFNTADPPPASTHNDTLRQLITEINDRSSSNITLAERSYQSFSEVLDQKGINSLNNNSCIYSTYRLFVSKNRVDIQFPYFREIINQH